VEDKYREHLPEDLSQKVRLGLQHVNFDSFLPSLHECILFRITVKQDSSHEDYADNVDHPCVVFLTLSLSVQKVIFFNITVVTCSL